MTITSRQHFIVRAEMLRCVSRVVAYTLMTAPE